MQLLPPAFMSFTSVSSFVPINPLSYLQQNTKCIGGYHCRIASTSGQKVQISIFSDTLQKVIFLIFCCPYANLKCFQCQEAYKFFRFSLNFHQKKTCISQVCILCAYLNSTAIIVCVLCIQPHASLALWSLRSLCIQHSTIQQHIACYCYYGGNTKPTMSKCNLHERFISLFSNVHLVSKTTTNDPLQMLSIPLLSS